eukprot:NODE_4158_length_603_cov_3936.124549_g2995_i0.p1 GENE.NODE_4158_length_603_cov_3936.124549_g2995_i0~~NODE_4158_length_603_cov_3936.124549_g2995_i0.p1  ORF type:complete len:144 (-),score=30.75 NODE_4158_length_603_cov_3936.124549_g2995_i0:144-575(-)
MGPSYGPTSNSRKDSDAMVHTERRVQYRRHNMFRTKSNKVKKVRTPGGRLVLQYKGKTDSGPKTSAATGLKPIAGIKHMSSMQRHNAKKRELTVNRIYGGVLTHTLVRERITRAFLIEEQKIVKRVLRAQAAKRKRYRYMKKH